MYYISMDAHTHKCVVCFSNKEINYRNWTINIKQVIFWLDTQLYINSKTQLQLSVEVLKYDYVLLQRERVMCPNDRTLFSLDSILR